MANGRHSYIAFYPSDWLAGTARMSRLHRSVYFDVCLYNWDTAQPCPAIELSVMISDLKGGARIVEELIVMRKLQRNGDGSVENPKAMAEARKAQAAWEAMSRGGKGVRKGVDNPHGNGEPIEPELEPEPEYPSDTIPHKPPKKILAPKPDEISDELWADFKTQRAKKDAPITVTALKGIEREAAKAGWTLAAAITEICERGWAGFKADWVRDKGKSNGNGSRHEAGRNGLLGAVIDAERAGRA